jgi:hypothetical protein
MVVHEFRHVTPCARRSGTRGTSSIQKVLLNGILSVQLSNEVDLLVLDLTSILHGTHARSEATFLVHVGNVRDTLLALLEMLWESLRLNLIQRLSESINSRVLLHRRVDGAVELIGLVGLTSLRVSLIC